MKCPFSDIEDCSDCRLHIGSEASTEDECIFVRIAHALEYLGFHACVHWNKPQPPVYDINKDKTSDKKG